MSTATPGRDGGGRRRKRVLTPQQKYEIWLQLVTGELSQNQAADEYGVDRSTIARIRVVAKQGALDALARSKPGRRGDELDPELTRAQAEVARLTEAIKELSVENVLLRAKSGWGS
jgi:transposase